MAIDKKLICFARLEEFERQLAAGNILDKSIVFIQDANKIYNRGTYYDCQSPYVLPFDIETLDGLSYSDNEGRLQTDADVFEKAKSAIEMGRMVVIRYGLSDAGYHICDATYNGDAISVRVYNGLMLYSFEIYASSQGDILVEQYSLQSELVDGVNIATINGQSLTAGGDLTIEGGAKVYTWSWDGSESGTLTQDEMDAIASAEAISIIRTNSLAIISTEFKTNFLSYLSLATLIDETGVYKVLFSFNPTSLEWEAIKYNLGLDAKEAYPITIIGQTEDGGVQCAEGTFSDIINNDILKMSINGDRFSLVYAQTDELIAVSETYFFNYDNEIKDLGYVVLRITSDDIVYEQDAIEFAKLSDIPTKTSQLENDSNFITSEDVAAVALSGSYNDLQDTPTIPSAVTESTVSGWGFTKNTGTYSKPSGGIPKSDLASAVQTSLGKADTALQSYTEQYKGTVTGVKINGTTKNPSSGVVDLGTVITDVSNLVSKDFTGELITAQTQALQGGGLVYALPDQANGDEDDILLSKYTVKTINGESIFGSGDIEIGDVIQDYVDSAIANAITTTLNTAV